MKAISPAVEHRDARVSRLKIIAPRRGLPNGRALLGALLISLAAIGAYVGATSGSDGPSTEFLVLTTPIGAGEPVALSAVALRPMDIPDEMSASALNSTVGLDGATALRDLRAGELLSVDDLLAAPLVDGAPIGSVHEVSIPVPLDRTPSGLVRGDRVTVLSTLRILDTPTTVVALEDAVVVSFESGSSQIGSTGSGVLTLAIADADSVVSTAHLSQQGNLTVVRSTRAIADSYPRAYSVDQVALTTQAAGS